jgi:hypothetical protein
MVKTIGGNKSRSGPVDVRNRHFGRPPSGIEMFASQFGSGRMYIKQRAASGA